MLRYVATHSPELSAESRFCLSRPFLFFSAVHDHAVSNPSWMQKDRYADSPTIEHILRRGADRTR